MKFFKSLTWDKFERTVGGMKFAVILITIFTIFMIVGTFAESYHGADFAQKFIYKKWPFIVVQILMFMSICFAAFLRMPPRKKLYGFYTIHSGLIVIAAGATITYVAGIDGNILLHPNEPTRRIILNEDILRVSFPNEGKQVTRDLPYTAFPAEIDEVYEGIHFKTFLPYSTNELKWRDGFRESYDQAVHSSQYQLFNEQMSEEVLLSLHPDTIDFESTKTLGPLNLHYLPEGLETCFSQTSTSGYIIWNSNTQTCTNRDLEDLDIQTTSAGNEFFVHPHEGELLTFFPSFSPWPLNDQFEVQRNANLRLFNKNLFQDSPHLFLFGETVAFYNGETREWESQGFDDNQLVDLPWMDLRLRLLHHEDQKMPVHAPVYMRPIMEGGAVVQGDQQALLIEVEGQEYWITDMRPVTLLIRGRKVTIEVGKKTLNLPFEFVLTQFHMDTNPGTQTAASFESFVRVFTQEGPREEHIYMNNPLKYQGFTFYQASYSENADGSYSSTLSANVDQGRPMKYFGSLLVVLGSMWHYKLNRRRKLVHVENSKKKVDIKGDSPGENT